MTDIVESFQLDHRKVKAPYVRKADRLVGPRGDVVTKFDLRFLQPNAGALPTGAIHTLEHLLAVYLREELEGVIDLSPMGCRTGFYLILFGEQEEERVKGALVWALQRVLDATDVPAANEIQCGHYRDHSLSGAKEYARMILAAL
ncbi:MAG TPA: S-ribosylhomocysteine lyase [Firmicutes bacterium]|jgi:S-ribosylhomocysteine lyase|nr:S-ribosylhomocysteine lyase [Bacillota bacterium]